MEDRSLYNSLRMTAHYQNALEMRTKVEKFVATKSGREELEQASPPDYDSMNRAQLRIRLTLRGEKLVGPNERRNYASQLRKLWVSWKGTYEEMKTAERKERFQRERKALYARSGAMSAGTFKAEPGRKSFLDLPGEIRNMVYDLALFGSSEDEYASAGDWTITYNGKRFHPPRSPAYLEGASLGELKYDRTVSTVMMLAALDKQIRQEARTYFWSRIGVTLDSMLDPFGYRKRYLQLLEIFLQKLGAEGRGAISKLNMVGTTLKFEYGKYQRLGRVLQSLRNCTNLRVLALCLTVDTLFGPADQIALKKYLLHGEAFDSPSLNNFVGVLRFLPRLRSLKLHMAPDRPRDIVAQREKEDDFLYYAFTGSREKRLLQKISDKLASLQGVRLEFIGGREHIDNYEEWLSWRPGRERY